MPLKLFFKSKNLWQGCTCTTAESISLAFLLQTIESKGKGGTNL